MSTRENIRLIARTPFRSKLSPTCTFVTDVIPLNALASLRRRVEPSLVAMRLII